LKVYIMNAFADGSEGGNPAGVVYFADKEDLSEDTMQKIAAELNFSETAFVHRKNETTFSIRYFTPACEVPLCGHATIAAFSLLRQKGLITDGIRRLLAGNEELDIRVSDGIVLMEMPLPVLEEELELPAAERLCHAFEIELSDLDRRIPPRILTAGLRDIHLCVKNRDILMRARQQEDVISEISGQFGVTGVHMSCLSPDDSVTAYCSNFAPACGISEECATGTSNAGLTFYLYQKGFILPEQENLFLQGEHMGRLSKVYSRVLTRDGISVWIGGRAVCVADKRIE